MELFSFSRLNLYQTCPYRFYKRYVEKLKEPDTYPLALGKAVHKAIEERLNGTDFQTAIELGMLEANFHPEVTEEELAWLVSNAPIQDLYGRVKTELHFELPLAEGADEPRLIGYIDIVGEGFIIDWKTNRIPYEVKDNHQLALYAWATNQLYGWTDVHATLYFLRFNRYNSVVLGLEEMEEAKKWAYDLAKEIQGKVAITKHLPELKNELFPAKVQNFCANCPFAYDCHLNFSPFA